ncbi:hypothetical protein [Streptomyces sp. NPDC001678]|uniref:hypothetical protein n=1 Tax=Streptomyces sp. NPDC001678 TaxID=3364599 RepID=UPI0036883849
MEICWRQVDSVPRYSFPWRAAEFFDCMPEAVTGRPPELASMGLDPSERFDLVILGWQVWFLSPSLPMQAFFAAPEAAVLRGTRVISVICCRQMWQRAYGRMRRLIARAGGVLTDNIVLTHQGGSSAGYLTAPWLMITGRREKLSFLPAAGVSRSEIQGLGRFGQRLRETVDRWAEPRPAPLLSDLAPAKVPTASLLPEMAVAPLMVALARIARLCGGPGSVVRKPVILLFVLMLVVTLPVLLVTSAVLTPVLGRVFAGRLIRYLRGTQALDPQDGCS